MKIAKIQNNFKINNQIKFSSKSAPSCVKPWSKISFGNNFEGSYRITGISKPFFLAALSRIETDEEELKDYAELVNVDGKYSPERALAFMNIYGMHKNSNEEMLHSTQKYQNADDATKAKMNKKSARNALMLASRTMDLCSKDGFVAIDTLNLPIAMNAARAASSYPDMPFYEFSMMSRDLNGNFSPHIAAGIFTFAEKTQNFDPIVTGNIVEDYCLTPEYELDMKALDIAAEIYNAWGEYNADEVIDHALNLKKDKMDKDLAKIVIDMIKFFDSCDYDLVQAKIEFGDDDEEEDFEDEFINDPEFFESFPEEGDFEFAGINSPSNDYPEDEEFPEEFDEEELELDMDSPKFDTGYVKMVNDSIEKMINMVMNQETGDVDLIKYEKIFAKIKEKSGADLNSFVRIITNEY